MRKFLQRMLFILLLLPLLVSCKEATDETVTAKNNSKWNVMIYMCGSTLEEQSGVGSYNLSEIASTKPNSDVDVYIMTGGVRSSQGGWKNKYPGYIYYYNFPQSVQEMDLSKSVDGSYQYWKYSYDAEKKRGVFTDITPSSKSMNDPSELKSFIKFCNDLSPNRKNLLCLWDHGSGLYGGLMEDYTSVTTPTSMSLTDMGLAVKNSKVHFDAVIMDLCLMQTLETALCLSGNADYLIAAQDNISGYGTAYSKWVQYLYDNPSCTPSQLGRTVCDTIYDKYYTSQYSDILANYEADTMTMSVVNLLQLKPLATAMDAVYSKLQSSVYYQSSEDMTTFMTILNRLHRYGTSPQCSYDINEAAKALFDSSFIDASEYNSITQALEDVVVYNKTGSTQNHSSGLSFSLSFAGDKCPKAVTSFIENFCSYTPNYKALMEDFYNLTYFSNVRLAFATGTDVNTIGTLNSGILAVPSNKNNLIQSIFVWYLLRDKNLAKESIFYGCQVLKPQVSAGPSNSYYYLAQQSGYEMPFIRVTTATTTTDFLCSFYNASLNTDDYGTYEEYMIPMRISDTNFNSDRTLVLQKDSVTKGWTAFVYDPYSYIYSDSRYQGCKYFSEFQTTILSSYPDAEVSFGNMLSGTPSTTTYKDFVKLSSINQYSLSIETTPATNIEIPENSDYYRTYRYLITDIYGNTTTLHSDVEL